MPTETEKINRKIRIAAKLEDKLAVQNLIDIYRDRWDYIIDGALQEQFTDKTFRNLYWLKTKELNLVKRIVNDLSVVYKESAQRGAFVMGGLNPETGEVEKQREEVYDQIVQQSELDTVQQYINKYTNLTNNLLQRVVFRNGMIEYDIINFNNCEIFTDCDDWKRVLAIKYYIGFEQAQQAYRQSKNPVEVGVSSDYEVTVTGSVLKYSKAYIYTFGRTGEKVMADGLIEGQSETLEAGKIYTVEPVHDQEMVTEVLDNPYFADDEIYPFVLYLKNYPIDELLDFSSGNDLYDLNLNVALNLVHLNNLIKYQSYKQLLIMTRDRKNIPSSLRLDPAEVLVLEDEEGRASAEVLELQSNIDNFYRVIQTRIQTVLAGYGISPENFSMSASPQSGFAMMISNMGKMEARQMQLPMYRNAEHRLFEVIRKVWNFHNPENMIDEKAEFEIDFAELTYPQSPSEQVEKATFLKMNNALTEVDILMQYNPDLTREQAIVKWRENKSFNMANQVRIEPLQQPGEIGG